MPYPLQTVAHAATSIAVSPSVPDRLRRPTVPAVCPHPGCRFRPAIGPFAALNPLSPAHRLQALKVAGFLRYAPQGFGVQVDWLSTILGCGHKGVLTLLKWEAGGRPSTVRRRLPGFSIGEVRAKMVEDWTLSAPEHDPKRQENVTCPICGRPASLSQSCAQAYPQGAQSPAARMLATLASLPRQAGAHLPLAWLATGAGLSTRQAASILRGAGYTVEAGYCAATRQTAVGVAGYAIPPPDHAELPS